MRWLLAKSGRTDSGWPGCAILCKTSSSPRSYFGRFPPFGVVIPMRSVAIRNLAWLVVSVLAVLLSSCTPPAHETTDPRVHSASSSAAAAAHDLSQDEAAGGHTLRKHTARSDDDLRERLEREPNIAAASTYADRAAAERVVGATLEQDRAKILGWLERSGGHPNLVLDYHGDNNHPIGRTLRRGEETPRPCVNAIVVLRWSGDDHYYVLTSYPECR
jgi:Bacterial CdiA-CT RNAse A domain